MYRHANPNLDYHSNMGDQIGVSSLYAAQWHEKVSYQLVLLVVIRAKNWALIHKGHTRNHF